MNGPFSYSKYVTGKQNFGRAKDIATLSNLLKNGENVVIIEPAKSGKMSLIKQTLFNLHISGELFSTAETSLFNIRTRERLVCALGSAILRNFGNTPSEYAELCAEFLFGTHLIFDPESYAATDSILSLNWDVDDQDIRAVLSLPDRICAARGQQCIFIISEFQNLLLCDRGEDILRMWEETLRANHPEDKFKCHFIFCGSRVNAMKEIFCEKKYFHRLVTRMHLSTIETKDIIDYTVRGFLTSGKVLDKEQMLGVCQLFHNNIGYINHFISICDSLSKGYIAESVLMDALASIISIHEPRFIATMDDLTTFQTNLLRAIVDGHKKFSSAEVIEKYVLNSSANVRRLKDALCKKEIISFDENDEPYIIDPLFEYWVKKFYFLISD